MADILWLTWQVQPIERRRCVTARQFQEAWDDPDREELAERVGLSSRALGSLDTSFVLHWNHGTPERDHHP